MVLQAQSQCNWRVNKSAKGLRKAVQQTILHSKIRYFFIVGSSATGIESSTEDRYWYRPTKGKFSNYHHKSPAKSTLQCRSVSKISRALAALFEFLQALQLCSHLWDFFCSKWPNSSHCKDFVAFIISYVFPSAVLTLKIQCRLGQMKVQKP